MSLFITSLNSGSNGNCYYIGNQSEAILVDAGISCRETEKRMRILGLSMELVKAVFISHEHTDHIRGLAGIADKYNLPVYITSHTLKQSCVQAKLHLCRELAAYEPISIGGLTVTAFPKHHDAIDPHSFIICYNGITVGVFTDIGTPCERLVSHFSQCHAAFLEANYDDEMLENGSYPWFLKNRIRGGKGHLSNRQALEIFIRHRPAFMTHLFLSHLSKDNNNPQIVEDMFNGQANGTRIVIASRYQQTGLYTIQRSTILEPVVPSLPAPLLSIPPLQLSLF